MDIWSKSSRNGIFQLFFQDLHLLEFINWWKKSLNKSFKTTQRSMFFCYFLIWQWKLIPKVAFAYKIENKHRKTTKLPILFFEQKNISANGIFCAISIDSYMTFNHIFLLTKKNKKKEPFPRNVTMYEFEGRKLSYPEMI